MVINRVVDEILRSWSRVAVLRALLDARTGCTGNEVARRAGMSPLAALKALSSLELLGIVYRQRGGRDHIFTLNRSHFMVARGLAPLYEAELAMPGALRGMLAKLLQRRVESGFIFGSVARKEETAESDLDLCCIVQTESGGELVRQVLERNCHMLRERFGVKLAPFIITSIEFRKRARSPLMVGMMRENILVAGRPPRMFLHAQASKQKGS